MRTKLTVGTGGINLAKTLFPETPTHREEGIVLGDYLMVLGAFGDLGALELSRDLAGMVI